MNIDTFSPGKAIALSILAVSLGACSSSSNSSRGANSDAYTVIEGGTLSRDASQGVLSNDQLDSTLTAQASVLASPSNGSLDLQADGSFNYQHNGSETTNDQFTYQVVQGTQQYTATVNLSVTPSDDAPVAGADVCAATTGNGTTASGQLTASDVDSNTNQITFSLSASDANATSGSSRFGASVELDRFTGQFTYNLGSANQRGVDSITFYAHSNGQVSAAGTASVISRVRIMPLGDSITEGVTSSGQPTLGNRVGYRARLYSLLNDNGYNFDFVGAKNYGTATSLPDGHNEGHGGFSPQDLRLGRSGPDPDGPPENHPAIGIALSTNPADIVLLHAGTNPSSSGFVAAEVQSLIGDIRQWASSQGSQETTIMLATIVPSINNPAGAPAPLNSVAFNNQLRPYANGQDVLLVEMEDVLQQQQAGDFGDDRIHPTAAGYDKMAERWYQSLTADAGPLKKCN